MRYPLAITMGDPSGIGPEVTVKALSGAPLHDKCIPIVIGDGLVLRDALSFTGLAPALREIASPQEAKGRPGVLEYIDLRLMRPDTYRLGVAGAASGEAAFQYIARAISLALGGAVAGVVTGPINKEALHLAGHPFAGHTEIFAEYTGTQDYAMLLIGGGLRVIHCTTHVSMRRACGLITRERVLRTILLAAEAMRRMGIDDPRIGVAGLNAHASENGLFGDEEARAIHPAVQAAQAQGLRAQGPIPPDTIFVKALAGVYDVVVAMYHDQGHIPLKLCGFRMDPATGEFTTVSGINTTVGLPILRTSVDHGTAFDRAGQNVANAQSMVDAIELAVRMAPYYAREAAQ